MERSERGKPTRLSCDWTNKKAGTSAPISLEDLMEKEVQLSTQDGNIRELSVLGDLTNKQSTKIKRKIRILDHPKNLIEVLRARLAIEKGITGNAITTAAQSVPFHQDLSQRGSTAHLRFKIDGIASGNCS